MQVTSGSEWAVSNGPNRRSWSISLDDNDGAALAGQDEWDAMAWNDKKTFLQKRADLEVILFMYKEGAITKDFMLQRAAAIKAA